jgi:hypothetical protein
MLAVRRKLALWAVKTQLCLIVFAFCDCAQTRIYRDGQLAAVIQGDAANVTFRSGDVYFHADTLMHSTATTAAYTGAAAMIGAVTTGVATSVIGGAVSSYIAR